MKSKKLERLQSPYSNISDGEWGMAYETALERANERGHAKPTEEEVLEVVINAAKPAATGYQRGTGEDGGFDD